MASELPTGVLGTLANSVKNIVTGQSGDVHTIHTDVEEDVEVEDTEVDTLAVEKADRTEDTQAETATIHKEKAAAVVHEDVKPHELEKVNTVVDKDVHQDHYHTTIVPVKDTKVLPTKHVYQENEAQREIDHRNNAAKKAAKAEAAAIHNEKEVEKTTYSREFAPTKKEEHVHHHIHETIQPVIERETIQEKVIHVTNHVHETEHLNDRFHGASVAPAITMADFEKGLGAEAVGTIEEVSLLEGAEADEVEQEEEEEELEEDLEDEEEVYEHRGPTTRSGGVTKEVSLSDFKKGRVGTTVNSRKRNAPTDADTKDLEPAAKVGKLAS